MNAERSRANVAYSSVFCVLVCSMSSFLLKGCSKGGPAETAFTNSVCEGWCEGDQWKIENGQKHKERHCDGDMSDLCGGCPHCGGAPAPSGGGDSRSGACEGWCEGDQWKIEDGQRHKERHCGGDMSDLCGDCPHCGGNSNPAPAPSGGGRNGNPAGTCVDTLAIGDFGTQNSAQKEVANGLAQVAGRVNPDSILGLGDSVYEDGHVNGIEPTMRIYTDHQALRKPWHMITGNHDWYNDATHQKDYKANSFWNMPHFYYKTQHQAGDVMVDMFHIDTEIWTCFADIGAGGGGTKRSFHHHHCGQYQKAQEDWLRTELSGSSASYKVVLGHHPMYSIGLHGHEANVHSHLRGSLASIMKEGGANIYLSGHDHSVQYNYANGFHQIISGGGAKTCRGGEKWGNVPDGANRFFHCNKGFVGVRFCKNEVTFTAYDAGGVAMKDFTLS